MGPRNTDWYLISLISSSKHLMKHWKLNILKEKKRKKVLFSVVRNEEFEEYGEDFLSLLRILQAVFGNMLCIRTLWI